MDTFLPSNFKIRQHVRTSRGTFKERLHLANKEKIPMFFFCLVSYEYTKVFGDEIKHNNKI